MKFCAVVPEICCGQVHGPWKERRKRIRIIRIKTRYDYNLTWIINDRDIKFDNIIGHH
jgi:hypothetical protein